MTSDDYIKGRVEDQIAWYDKESSINKRNYLCFQTITFVTAALVPVFSIFSEDLWARVIVTILGSAAMVTTGILALFKYLELWIKYRTTAESVKHEKYMFQTGMGPYTGDDRFTVLVERTEALISQENSSWQQLLIIKKKADKQEQMDGVEN